MKLSLKQEYQITLRLRSVRDASVIMSKFEV